MRYYIKHDGKYVKSIGISTSYQGIDGLRYTVGYSNKENGMHAYSLELVESISKSIGGYYEKDKDGADKVMARVMYYVREDEESGLGEDIRYFTNKEEADRFAKEYERDYGEKVIVGIEGDD